MANHRSTPLPQKSNDIVVAAAASAAHPSTLLSTLHTATIVDQWYNQEDSVLLMQSLEYLDVVTLIKKKPINKRWNELCTKTIDDKCVDKKAFETRMELKDAVNKYSPGFSNYDKKQCQPMDAEELSSKYGYPIGNWDVSNVSNFDTLFDGKRHFNEPIGSWDVSNARTMHAMFVRASSFNQDISSWDVSNVTDMGGMFYWAGEFNHPIGSWDVSNATSMHRMFFNASSFNQDLSNWNVANVKDMSDMFWRCFSFNQDIRSWDVSNVNDFHGMFFNCAVLHAENFPWFTREMRHF